MHPRSGASPRLADMAEVRQDALPVLERLLTPPEVAELCRVSVKTVLRAIHAGRLTGSRLGRRGTYRVRAADVEAWLAGTVVEPAPQEPPPIRVQSIDLALPGASSPASGRLRVTDGMGRR